MSEDSTVTNYDPGNTPPIERNEYAEAINEKAAEAEARIKSVFEHVTNYAVGFVTLAHLVTEILKNVDISKLDETAAEHVTNTLKLANHAAAVGVDNFDRIAGSVAGEEMPEPVSIKEAVTDKVSELTNKPDDSISGPTAAAQPASVPATPETPPEPDAVPGKSNAGEYGDGEDSGAELNAGAPDTDGPNGGASVAPSTAQ